MNKGYCISDLQTRTAALGRRLSNPTFFENKRKTKVFFFFYKIKGSTMQPFKSLKPFELT